jgi:hypothetical protein
MRLLDALEGPAEQLSDRFDVFDCGDVDSMGRMDFYVPGITPVFQTPVVGVWDGGTLVERGSGFDGRQILVRRYGLSDDWITTDPRLPRNKGGGG